MTNFHFLFKKQNNTKILSNELLTHKCTHFLLIYHFIFVVFRAANFSQHLGMSVESLMGVVGQFRRGAFWQRCGITEESQATALYAHNYVIYCSEWHFIANTNIHREKTEVGPESMTNY